MVFYFRCYIFVVEIFEMFRIKTIAMHLFETDKLFKFFFFFLNLMLRLIYCKIRIERI